MTSPGVIPGEILCAPGEIELNPDRPRVRMTVINTGDRPIQVGSHVHFPAANSALKFDRVAAHGLRLDIAAGTAVRFEPGIAISVSLVAIAGSRVVPGISLPAVGALDD